MALYFGTLGSAAEPRVLGAMTGHASNLRRHSHVCSGWVRRTSDAVVKKKPTVRTGQARNLRRIASLYIRLETSLLSWHVIRLTYLRHQWCLRLWRLRRVWTTSTRTRDATGVSCDFQHRATEGAPQAPARAAAERLEAKGRCLTIATQHAEGKAPETELRRAAKPDAG